MKKEHLSIAVFSLITLFFIQMAGTLVESIYILNLLNTSLDERVLGLLFFFSPFLLLPFGKKAPRWLVWGSLGVLLVARGLTPYLDTPGRMVVSGIGTGAALILLPVILSRPSGTNRGLIPAQGLALAVGLSVLLRTLNYTLDLSMTREYGWTGWVLVVLLGVLAFRLPEVEDEEEDISGDGKGTISAVLGLVTVLTLVYFVFSSPGVLARWTEGNYQLIVITVSLFSLLWFALTLVKPSLLSQLKPSLINLWNIAFALSLVSTILAHSIKFPPSLDSPPVVVTSPFWYEQIPLVLTLLLFPVVFVDFGLFAGAIAAVRPSPRKIGSGFLLGALFLVILVFMNIFTNVWGYVEPVSTVFRNKFWLPFTLISGVIALLAAVHLKGGSIKWKVESGGGKALIPSIVLGIIFLGTVVGALSTDRVTQDGEGGKTLKVMTYNIQGANDDSGEKSYLQQLALMQRESPDIIALQENDSARISLGNNDYVRYFTSKLGYYSYYGPKTVTGTYGTAVLSRYPIENPLTVFTFSDQDEIGTVEVEVQVGETWFTVYNLHPDGSDEAKTLTVGTVLDRAEGNANTIVMGDYNIREGEDGYELIDAEYKNAWMDYYPTGIDDDGLDMSGDKRIDHIFVSPHLEVVDPVYVLPPESWTDHPVHWTEIAWD
jgi:endonuclease/exonuclease/phosphatase family metal-dependent hydrolase